MSLSFVKVRLPVRFYFSTISTWLWEDEEKGRTFKKSPQLSVKIITIGKTVQKVESILTTMTGGGLRTWDLDILDQDSAAVRRDILGTTRHSRSRITPLYRAYTLGDDTSWAMTASSDVTRAGHTGCDGAAVAEVEV
jgi:hypothetical protein